MMLAVTAISDVVFLNNDLTFNRKLSKMFGKIMNGIKGKLFSGNGKLFCGNLCFVLRDIPNREYDEAIREFRRFVNNISDKKYNFLKVVFSEVFCECLEHFEKDLFEEGIIQVRRNIIENLENEKKDKKRWINGADFSETFKIILAQIIVQDNTDMMIHKINIFSENSIKKYMNYFFYDKEFYENLKENFYFEFNKKKIEFKHSELDFSCLRKNILLKNNEDSDKDLSVMSIENESVSNLKKNNEDENKNNQKWNKNFENETKNKKEKENMIKNENDIKKEEIIELKTENNMEEEIVEIKHKNNMKEEENNLDIKIENIIEEENNLEIKIEKNIDKEIIENNNNTEKKEFGIIPIKNEINILNEKNETNLKIEPTLNFKENPEIDLIKKNESKNLINENEKNKEIKKDKIILENIIKTENHFNEIQIKNPEIKEIKIEKNIVKKEKILKNENDINSINKKEFNNEEFYKEIINYLTNIYELNCEKYQKKNHNDWNKNFKKFVKELMKHRKNIIFKSFNESASKFDNEKEEIKKKVSKIKKIFQK